MDEIKLQLIVPRSIIDSSREIILRITLEDDGKINNDYINTQIITKSNDYLLNCTANNWKSNLYHFLYSLGFRDEEIVDIIVNAVDLAIRSNNFEKVFSRLANNDSNLSKHMHNLIANRMKNREVSRLIFENCGRTFTPQGLVEFLYGIIISQIKST